MTDWLDYTPRDFLLFSPETYYRLFALHNEAVWPAHLYVAALVTAILVLSQRGSVDAGRLMAAILGAVWLWVAWAFHYERFATIHLAAPWYAAAFALQGFLLLLIGFFGRRLIVSPDRNAPQLIGYTLFLFAIFIQPLASLLLGRDLFQSEMFGMAPDPTAIGTLGLLLASNRPHWFLMIVPLLWCAVSGVTLWTMQSPEWFVMPAAGVLAAVLLFWKPFAKPTRPAGELSQPA